VQQHAAASTADAPASEGEEGEENVDDIEIYDEDMALMIGCVWFDDQLHPDALPAAWGTRNTSPSWRGTLMPSPTPMFALV